jgi:PAS domain S-box-containing protein
MRVTAKLLITFLIIALIPLAVLGYLSYASAKQALQEQALSDLAVIAEAKEGHMHSFIDGIRGRAVDFSSDGFIRDSLESLSRMPRDDPRYPLVQEALNRHLRINKMPLDESIHMIAVMDLDGRIVGSTEEGDMGRVDAMEDYFIQGKRGVYVSDVRLSHHLLATEHPYHIAVAAPLTGRETGDLIGVIVNFYDTHELDKILSGEYLRVKGAGDASLGRETMEVYLVNRERLMITASRYVEDAFMRQQVETEPVLRCLDGGETTGVYTNYLGVEVIGASRCVDLHGWVLLAEVSAEEAFAPAVALRNRVLILGVFVGFTATIVALVAAREIAAPITELARATKKLASGDYRVRVRGRRREGRDEIGDLSASFNAMVGRLQDSQAKIRRLAAIAESSADAIVGLDLEARVQEWNKGAERLFGYTREEMLGRSFIEMLPEEVAEAEKICLAEVVEEGYVENHESIRVHKDGHWVPVLMTATLLKDAEGSITGISAVMKDLTEIKRLQKEISQEKKRLETLIRGVKEGVAFADEEDRVVLLNASAERLLGVKAAEVVGRPVLECHRVKTEKVAEVLRAFRRGELEYHVGEISYRGRELEITASSIHRDGDYLGTVMILRDITERKMAEQQLKDYARELEHSNELKELFTDIMRHDLQNPVAVIKGLSGVLLDRDLPPDQRKILGVIKQNAEKLSSMIESASKYAKLDSTEKLEFQEVDLATVLKGVIKGFRPLLEEKKIRLSYRVEGDVGVLRAMANQVIEDAFANILSNAIKYSPVGGEIVVEIQDRGDRWRVAVKDRGPGVPDESKEAIFSRFERVHKKGIKGTGLGLAIVRRIVELHSGRVWVEDNPGGGSIFYVSLPKAASTSQ